MRFLNPAFLIFPENPIPLFPIFITTFRPVRLIFDVKTGNYAGARVWS